MKKNKLGTNSNNQRQRRISAWISANRRWGNSPDIDVVDADDVISVYSGRDRACCCGCSGKHSYASKYRAYAGRHRGYKVQDNEMSDLTVKRIVGKINKSYMAEPQTTSMCAEYMTAVIGKRLYIAYFK